MFPNYRILAVNFVSCAMLLSVAMTARGDEKLTVKISETAKRVNGGTAAEVTLLIRCPASLQLLESLVYIVQDEHQSQFSGVPVIVDGKQHRQVVQVRASEEGPLFHAGEARVSAFVQLYDPQTGDTVSASPTRIVKLK